jgi:hypothetical protein
MSAQFKRSTIEALQGAGINAETAEADLKKAYFKTTSTPLAAAKIADLRSALGGNEANIIADADVKPKAAKVPKEKKEKAPKPPKEPKPVKEAEAPDVAMARLKADPKTAARWTRVTQVLAMGKKGPTRVRILCDNKGPAGEDLFRDIAVQDLFQVKYSADFAKKAARKARAATKKTEAPAAAPTA